MRTTRLYFPGELVCDETIHLDSQASSHLIRVLRSRAGSPLVLFNGDGFNYHARTLDTNPRKTTVVIESKTANDNESCLSVTLIQGLSRQDRMDTTIQKSVELGVNRIIPLICQYSNMKLNADKRLKKHQHWQKVAISACEQSGRSIIPEILPATPLHNLLALLAPDAQRFALVPEAEQSLKDCSARPATVEFIIGPEGGLADEEITFLRDNDFNALRFGPRILRTETAGPAVISAMQLLWGDF